MLLTVNVLLVGIETNPGPARRQPTTVKLSTLNARSAVLHTADLHLLIADESIDVLEVCETRVRHDTPDAISMDIAPPGCRIVHYPPLTVAKVEVKRSSTVTTCTLRR